MEPDPSHVPSGDDSPNRPATPILTYGTFGARTPAGRRYHIRSGIALAAMAVCMMSGLLTRSVDPTHRLDLVTMFAPGAAFIYIAWEFRRYLAALDELARRIQLESIAWTYLSGLAIAMLFGGLAMVYGWKFNAFWYIALEPVRAGWLYFVSRRYQ